MTSTWTTPCSCGTTSRLILSTSRSRLRQVLTQKGWTMISFRRQTKSQSMRSMRRTRDARAVGEAGTCLTLSTPGTPCSMSGSGMTSVLTCRKRIRSRMCLRKRCHRVCSDDVSSTGSRTTALDNITRVTCSRRLSVRPKQGSKSSIPC